MKEQFSNSRFKASMRAFFLALLLMITAGLTTACSTSYKFDSEAKDGEYIINTESVNISEEPEYFRVQINTAPKAAFGERIPFFIGNPKENKSDVQVRIYLTDSKDELYCSSVLSPGEREAYGRLPVSLESGEYEAIAIFSILDEDGIETGSVETGLIITIN